MRMWQAGRKFLTDSETSLKMSVSFHLTDTSTVLVILLFSVSGFDFGELTLCYCSFQVMDYNINLGKHLLPLVVQVLKYCTCPQLRHYFQQPPRCSLWSLKPHIRQMWLKALLVILYKVSGLKKMPSAFKFTLQFEIYYREHLTVLQVKGIVKNTLLWFACLLHLISVSEVVRLSSGLLTSSAVYIVFHMVTWERKI